MHHHWRTLLLLSLCAPSLYAQQDQLQHYAEAGNAALAAGHYSEAEADYEKLRQLAPEVAEVRLNLGLIYFEEGRFEQAVPELRHALKLKPSLIRAEYLLAISLAETGEYEAALPGLEKGFRQDADAEMRRMCGLHLTRAYTALSRSADATQTALKLDQLYPDDPEVLYQTSKIYGNSAYLNIQKLAKTAPDSVWTHLAAAEANESQDATDAAIAEYRAVLRIQPDRPNIHFRIGRTLLARWQTTQSEADLKTATQEFEQELALDASNANAAYELAEIARKAGDYGKAETCFRQAIAHYPDFGEAHLGLAAVLMAENKPQDALPEAEKAASLEPDNPVAWYRLAQIERAVGNTAERDRALAKFQSLRNQKQEQPRHAVSNGEEITMQTIDRQVQQ